MVGVITMTTVVIQSWRTATSGYEAFKDNEVLVIK